MEEPPASSPVSTAPRAFRGAELRQLLARFADEDGCLATPPPDLAAARDEEAPSFAVDLLAGVTTGEPVSSPPPAVNPARDTPSGRRPRLKARS